MLYFPDFSCHLKPWINICVFDGRLTFSRLYELTSMGKDLQLLVSTRVLGGWGTQILGNVRAPVSGIHRDTGSGGTQ